MRTNSHPYIIIFYDTSVTNLNNIVLDFTYAHRTVGIKFKSYVCVRAFEY
jgi:hypothetical protein